MQTAGKAVAIITARGGSKRIPHKNIKEFCGKPILAYSIEAALASGVFDRVMVSNVGNILIPCVVSIPPLLLLHLTGWRKQCACWKKKRGTPCCR